MARPLTVMTGTSVGSWAAISVAGGAPWNPEFALGMAGPLVSAALTWLFVERTHARAPERVTGVLIAGFAITGTSSDTVSVRGVGPSLGTLFGMRRALGASHVAVFDSKGNQVAANTVWTHGREGHDDDEDDATNDVETASDRAGAWKLPRGATDSALVLTLPPGVYTAHVTGVGKTGIGLVEVFEIH